MQETTEEAQEDSAQAEEELAAFHSGPPGESRRRSAFSRCRIAPAVALVAIIACAGCGGGASKSSKAVAQIRGAPAVTSAELEHWTLAMAGVDYYEASQQLEPRSLVSSPPDYPACVKEIQKTLPKGNGMSEAQLSRKCRQLYRAVRDQALNFLILTHWDEAADASVGVRLTGGESRRGLAQLKSESYPRPGQLDTYLAERRWSLADELLYFKQQLLQSKVQAHFGPARTAEMAKFVAKRVPEWTPRTSCAPGYVVERCKQYRPSSQSASQPSAAVLSEEISKLRSPGLSSPG
jgi:hypothetical protein